jgi:selenocysteine lyase/cysteine desulfurase
MHEKVNLREKLNLFQEQGRVWRVEATRTSLVVLEPRSEPSAEVFARLIAGGVHVAHRRGRIRISPHLYNTLDEIDQTLQLLHNSATRGS